MDSNSSESFKKREAAEEDETREAPRTQTQTASPKANIAKRRVNNLLLVNAMRTTAVYTSQSFSVPPSASEVLAGDPSASIVERSSETPGPASQIAATPRSVSGAPTPQDLPPGRGPQGGVKKKKKRESSGHSKTPYPSVLN